uniref:Uncharacterized protein n=1 Tax=Meloidogyne hapla TaxID=6305 RepID=A0A1I8BB09_MELHA
MSQNLQIIKTLRLDALSRKLTSQRDFALNNCEHDKEYTKQQICKRIDEKLEQVENEMKQIEDNFYDEIVSSFNSNHQTNKLSKQRLGRLKWGINRYLTSNNENNKIQQNLRSKRSKYSNLPLMIAQLPKNKIMEDLELIL